MVKNVKAEKEKNQKNKAGKLSLEERCVARGLRMTGQRRIVAQVLSEADDHPDVEELHRRASVLDSRISLATVYRAVRLFEEVGILERHDFRDGRSRYEAIPDEHHDHLIDLQSGKVVEFRDDTIEELQKEVARKLGYRLMDHRLELYGVPLSKGKGKKTK
ncbi:MAG: Fur family transcriptional regulator [Parvularculales bacterium]